MRELLAPTDGAWVERVVPHLDELLLDQAHCEKKAAGAAVQLLFRYPEQGFLQAPLSRLAREELAHFEEVLALLARRGVAFRRQKPAPYAGRLRAAARQPEPGHLVDTLLCSALIEARSCERLGLLADAVSDAELARFYRRVHSAEARHHDVYVELAHGASTHDSVSERLRALAEIETEILAASCNLPRMHS